MTQEELEKLLEAEIIKLKEIIITKGKEYMRGNDRLSNFKQAAGVRRRVRTPEGALLGMLIKHWVSIADFVDDIEEGKVAPISVWDEKLGDNIVYSILLKALIMERWNKTSIEEEHRVA